MLNKTLLVQVIFKSLLTVIGVPLNLHGTYKLLRAYVARRSLTAFFLLKLHLSLADLFILCIYNTSRLAWMLTTSFYGGQFMCAGLQSVNVFSFYLSSNIVACIAIERFMVVWWPHANHRFGNTHTKTRLSKAGFHRAKVLLAAAYIWAFVCSLPHYFLWRVLTTSSAGSKHVGPGLSLNNLTNNQSSSEGFVTNDSMSFIHSWIESLPEDETSSQTSYLHQVLLFANSTAMPGNGLLSLNNLLVTPNTRSIRDLTDSNEAMEGGGASESLWNLTSRKLESESSSGGRLPSARQQGTSQCLDIWYKRRFENCIKDMLALLKTKATTPSQQAQAFWSLCMVASRPEPLQTAYSIFHLIVVFWLPCLIIGTSSSVILITLAKRVRAQQIFHNRRQSRASLSRSTSSGNHQHHNRHSIRHRRVSHATGTGGNPRVRGHLGAMHQNRSLPDHQQNGFIGQENGIHQSQPSSNYQSAGRGLNSLPLGSWWAARLSPRRNSRDRNKTAGSVTRQKTIKTRPPRPSSPSVGPLHALLNSMLTTPAFLGGLTPNSQRRSRQRVLLNQRGPNLLATRSQLMYSATLKRTLCLCTAYLLCWLPYNVLKLGDMISPGWLLSNLTSATFLMDLMIVNAAINPLIYRGVPANPRRPRPGGGRGSAGNPIPGAGGNGARAGGVGENSSLLADIVANGGAGATMQIITSEGRTAGVQNPDTLTNGSSGAGGPVLDPRWATHGWVAMQTPPTTHEVSLLRQSVAIESGGGGGGGGCDGCLAETRRSLVGRSRSSSTVTTNTITAIHR